MAFIHLQRRQTLRPVFVSALSLSSELFHRTFCLSFTADSALDDFVLTHPVFIPNSQLCPVLMAQYPFSCILFSFGRPVKLTVQMKSLSSSIAFIFNPLCTYHAQASQGCEQERMDYTLNNKRRVIRLVMQWAAVHGDHLLEEEDAVAFLQVSWDNTAIPPVWMFDVSLSECSTTLTILSAALVLLSFPLKDSRVEFWQITLLSFLIVLGC